MKTVFVSEFILILFNSDYETILETDLSGYTTESVLSQFNNKSVLKSCMYFLKKNSSVKCNYKIYDKELLIIIHYL